MNSKELLIRGHLGLGDHLVTLGIVRKKAKDHESVVVLAKSHNCCSLRWAFRDDPVIHVLSVADDSEADQLTALAELKFSVLKLGLFNSEKFDRSKWDEQMYYQAGLEFDERWNSFTVPRQPSIELPVPSKPFVFHHDDRSRGFKMDLRRLPKGLTKVSPDPKAAPNIFAYWGILEAAQEIHCIDSAFACLVDSLPDLKAQRYVIHDYARQGSPPSRYAKPWEHWN